MKQPVFTGLVLTEHPDQLLTMDKFTVIYINVFIKMDLIFAGKIDAQSNGK